MQTNRLLAQQFPDEIFEEPTPPRFPDEIFEEEGPDDLLSVQREDLTPRNWVIDSIAAFFTSPNWRGSILQNLNDMWQLVQPVGRRASENVTLAPGMLDLARLFAETQHKGQNYSWWKPATSAWSGIFRGYAELDERLLGGTPQEGGETPLLDAMADYLTSRYDFSKPEVRAAFSQVVEEDPVGVMTDLLTVPSLVLGGAGAGAKAASVSAKMGRKMSKALGGVQRANRVMNQGFHIPGVPGKIVPRPLQGRVSDKGFEIKTGIVDLVDPGVWGLRGANRGVRALGNAGRRAASPYAPRGDEAQDAQDARAEGLARQGFTDAEPPDPGVETPLGVMRQGVDDVFNTGGVDDIYAPLSLINPADGLLGLEARRFNKGYEPVVRAVERTETQINTRVSEILEQVHADGDLGRAQDALAEAYEEARVSMVGAIEDMYREAGAEPGLVVDMRPVYSVLQELRAQEEVTSRLLTEPDADVPFSGDALIRNLYQNVDEIASNNQNMLSPEFLQGTETAPTRPVARATGQTAARTEDELYGTPARNAVDLNSGKEYATTYRIMELADVITSHTVEGNADARYQAELQVKDMSEVGSQQKVQNIARNLIPDQMLGGTRSIQQGAPILNQQNMAVSGNHRLNALRLAIQSFPDKWAAYIEELRGEMDQFGVTENLDDMEAPVLVRVLDDDVDQLGFARAANVSDVNQLSNTAQATQDMHILTDDVLNLLDVGDGTATIDDVLKQTGNSDFRKAYIDKLEVSEQPQFIGADGELSRRGLERLRNAVVAKLFGGNYGTAMRRTFTEMPTEGFKNIQRGIEAALPALAKLETHLKNVENMGDYDITEPLAEAVMKIRYLMETAESGAGVRKSIDTYLAGEQQSLGLDAGTEAWRLRELDEKGRTLLQLLSVGVRKPSVLREFLRDYANAVSRVSVDQTQTSLLGGAEVVPPDEFVDSFVTKHLEGEDALAEGLEEVLRSDPEEGAETPSDAPPSQARPEREAGRPILFENVIAYRNALAESIKGRRGGRLRNWRVQLLGALDEAIAMTLFQSGSQTFQHADEVNWVMDSVKLVRDRLNSTFAQTLTELTDGSRNLDDPAVQRALESVFTPSDTARSIYEKYLLMGGFNSDAGRRARRIFLEKLFGFIRTPQGQADAAAVARGDAPVGEIAARYRSDGISKFMNQFTAEAADYEQETLRAILGAETVDDLNELDIILQNFGRFMQRTKKSDSFFFGEGRASSYIMERISQRLGWNLLRGLGGGGVGGFLGGLPGMAAGAVVGFLLEWLGHEAMSRSANVLYGSEWGRRTLLNGVELSMRDAWDAGARVLFRGGLGEPPKAATTRTAARVGRTALKEEDE